MLTWLTVIVIIPVCAGYIHYFLKRQDQKRKEELRKRQIQDSIAKKSMRKMRDISQKIDEGKDATMRFTWRAKHRIVEGANGTARGVKLGASGLKNISKKAMSATKKFGLKSVNGTKNVFNNSIAKIFRRKLKE